MTHHRVFIIVAVPLIFSAACSDTSSESACEALLSCCQKLAPALQPQCQAVYDQWQGQKDAERQCQDAMATLGGPCSSATDGSVGSSECGGIGPSQGASQPCCPDLGIDACGAGLFCAAFDGRAQATCYIERSRPDQAECAADVQCMSGSCNVEQGRCRSLFGQACTPEIGCAPDPTGRVYICDPIAENGLPTNTCAPADSTEDGLCLSSEGCLSQHCVNGRCSSGEAGSPCLAGTDCAASAPICFQNSCSSGAAGSPCITLADCGPSAAICVAEHCSSGAVGSPCTDGSDCAGSAPHCVDHLCRQGTEGDPCETAQDCAPGFSLCSGGHCSTLKRLGESCQLPSDCAPNEAGTGSSGSAVTCDGGTCHIVAGGHCEWLTRHSCAEGYSCKAAPGGKCLDGTNKSCAGETCCGSDGSCTYLCFNGQTCQP